MFKHLAPVALLPLLCLFLYGCSSIIGATTSEPIQMDPGKRTLGVKIDDRQIETVAKVNLNKAHRQLADANINVHSYNAVVLLTGQVPNNDMRQLATETLLAIPHVRQVHNELEAQANTSLLARTNDTWLTTKVRTKLMTNRDIESGRVRVITENNTVFLMGLVSQVEADKITSIARHTGGVQKVVRVFEYID